MAREPALQSGRSGAESQLASRFLTAMAFITRLLENRRDVSFEEDDRFRARRSRRGRQQNESAKG